MWCVDDVQLRLVLLQHAAERFSPDNPRAVRGPGPDAALLARLQQLTALEMSTLAAMRQPLVRIELDEEGLQSGLRMLEGVIQAKELETYFIRHGASRRMMRVLFSVSYSATYRRRRAYAVPAPRSRFRLPPIETCERIWRTWHGLSTAPLRHAYYQLHQAYSQYSIALLEAVVQEQSQ
jgi:hypothetical protein